VPRTSEIESIGPELQLSKCAHDVERAIFAPREIIPVKWRKDNALSSENVRTSMCKNWASSYRRTGRPPAIWMGSLDANERRIGYSLSSMTPPVESHMTSHSTLLPPSSTTQCPPSSDPCQDAFDTCANVLVFFQHRAHKDSDRVRFTGSWGGASGTR